MTDSATLGTETSAVAKGVPMTRERYIQLLRDLTSLRDEDRPVLLDRMRRAPLLTDAASAEAVVQLAQQQVAAADQRIAELEVMLANAAVIGEGPAPATVEVGHHVRVRYEDGSEQTVTLVPPAEADPWRSLVSAESPLGKALLGKAPGEQARVQADGEATSVTVSEVSLPSETV